MKIKEIISAIESFAPCSLAYDFDNVGMLCGNAENEVKKVMLTLDLDVGVVNEAVKKGANLIIGHHPIMFNAISQIDENTPEGAMLFALIKNDITYYAAHTNLDIAKGGLNDLLAEKLELVNPVILEYIDDTNTEGIGRIGDAPHTMTLEEVAELVKTKLGAPMVRYCGNKQDKIRRIAVNTGGGTSLIDSALKANADVFITGDFRYNQARDVDAEGMKVIDVGHYDSERIVCELFEKFLKEKFPNAFEICISDENTNVMKFM